MPAKLRNPRIFTHDHRRRLERAVAHYLRECYRKKTAARVSELAAYMGLNPEYLTRIATPILGMHLRDYMRRKQLEEAHRLLTTMPRDLDLDEIARSAAFGTVATFYRWFTRAYGMPPGAFREVRK